MNLVTLYKAMLKRAATTMPEMPAMAGVVQPKVPQNPLPPPISIGGSAKPEDATAQTGLSQEGGAAQDTTIADLTSALNNITSVEKMKLKGEQMAQGIGQPQQGAALAQVTASQPSPQQGSGAAAPLVGINKASKALYANLGSVYKALRKRAAAYVPDQAATTADKHGLRTDFSSPAPTKHYYYNMPTEDGRPTMPKIQELGGAQKDIHKEIPRIMEYDAKGNNYKMHQYPYAKAGYPTSSTEQASAGEALLDPANKELPAASKANYQTMKTNGTFDPATALQYNEYLKWRKATGGKTKPVSN